MSADKKKESFNFDREFKIKIKLNDGKEEYVFSRGPKISEDEWPIKCFVCRRHDRINNKQQFRQHITADRHKKQMKKVENGLLLAKVYRQHLDLNGFKLFPGDDIQHVTTEFSHRLLPIKAYTWAYGPPDSALKVLEQDDIMDYNKKSGSPIFGICYGFKMILKGLIRYHCGLCDEELPESEAYQHFVGGSHYTQYVNRHFPETLERLDKIFGHTITNKEKKNIIRYMYKKLENLIGTRPFNLVSANMFEKTKKSFFSRLTTMVHYNENTIRYTDEEFKKILERLRTGFIKLPAMPPVLPKSTKTRGKPETDSDRSSKRRKISERDDRRDNWDNSVETWEKYRICCEKEIKKLKDDYRIVYDDSEKHSEYDKQWQKFWKKRTEDLELDGINPKTYDFTADWKRYWRRFLDNCFNEDILLQKKAIRKQLDLPFRAKTPELPKKFKEKLIREEYASYEAEKSIQKGQHNTTEILSGPITILSVLRLLSALESELGSLGPTAVQLLSRAIMYEKANQTPNELLHETEYFTLFATALEKLKGGLLAGVIPDNKLNATCQCVNGLEKLLQLFEEYLRCNPNSAKEHIPSNIILGIEVNQKTEFPQNIVSTVLFGNESKELIPEIKSRNMRADGNGNRNITLRQPDGYDTTQENINRVGSGGRHYLEGNNKSDDYYVGNSEYIKSGDILKLSSEKWNSDNRNQNENKLYGTRDFGLNKEIDLRNYIDVKKYGQHQVPSNKNTNFNSGDTNLFNIQDNNQNNRSHLGNKQDDLRSQMRNWDNNDDGLNRRNIIRAFSSEQNLRSNDGNWKFGNQNENSGTINVAPNYIDNQSRFSTQSGDNWKSASGGYKGGDTIPNKNFFGVGSGTGKNTFTGNINANENRGGDTIPNKNFFGGGSGTGKNTFTGNINANENRGGDTIPNKNFFGVGSGTGKNTFTGNINANENRESFQGIQKQNIINQSFRDNTTDGIWKSGTSSSSQFKTGGDTLQRSFDKSDYFENAFSPNKQNLGNQNKNFEQNFSLMNKKFESTVNDNGQNQGRFNEGLSNRPNYGQNQGRFNEGLSNRPNYGQNQGKLNEGLSNRPNYSQNQGRFNEGLSNRPNWSGNNRAASNSINFFDNNNGTKNIGYGNNQGTQNNNQNLNSGNTNSNNFGFGNNSFSNGNRGFNY